MTLNISQPTSLAIPIDVNWPSGGRGVWITQMLVVLSDIECLFCWESKQNQKFGMSDAASQLCHFPFTKLLNIKYSFFFLASLLRYGMPGVWVKRPPPHTSTFCNRLRHSPHLHCPQPPGTTFCSRCATWHTRHEGQGNTEIAAILIGCGWHHGVKFIMIAERLSCLISWSEVFQGCTWSMD